ncbi:MAG: hypothetical protein ACMXYL_01200 [Candidatus Woesearchaeota archaeon]
MVRKAQGLPLNTIIIAIIVIVVLVVLVLIFTGQMTIFGDTLGVFQCRGLDCDIIPGSLSDGSIYGSGVRVSVPDRVAVGNPVEVVVDDLEGIIASTGIYATSPSSGTVPGGTGGAIAVQRPRDIITGRVIDDGGGAGNRTFTIRYEETHTVGVYPYQVIGTLHNGTQVLLAEGQFTVYDPEAIIVDIKTIQFGPNPTVMGHPVHFVVTYDAEEDIHTGYGLLRRQGSNGAFGTDNVREIFMEILQTDHEDAVLYALIGDTTPLSQGNWVLDEDWLTFFTESGALVRVSLPDNIPTLEVMPPESCTDSSRCMQETPFCVETEDGLGCMTSCASLGMKAGDASSCCEGLVFDAVRGACYESGNEFTFVIVPLGYPSYLYSIYRERAYEVIQAFREELPIRECTHEEIGFRFVIVDDMECIEECQYTIVANNRFAINAERQRNIESCFSEALECAERNVDGRVDRVIGLSANFWEYYYYSGGELVSDVLYSGIARLYGRVGLSMAEFPPPKDAASIALHESGHTFGLHHLSCNPREEWIDTDYPAGACSGVNHQDCQPSCTEPIDYRCSVPPYTCSPEEFERCLSNPEYNKGFLMDYCDPYGVFGPAGYDYMKYESDMYNALVVCGAIS